VSTTTWSSTIHVQELRYNIAVFQNANKGIGMILH